MVKVDSNSLMKNSLITWALISSFSFVYGGVYTEMFKEGLGFNLSNIALALFGAVVVGFPFFIGAYILQYIYVTVREKRGK